LNFSAGLFQVGKWIQVFSHELNSVHTVLATLLRLVIACALGGMIGIERELKHRHAGLRTQMLVCFGSAFFTILSDLFAQSWGGDHTRIAAQIIPGIGFIGAGSILHARGSVSGITTATTLFVVAAIGMAVGGGMYLPATFATILLLLALYPLGYLEERWRLKTVVREYTVFGDDQEKLMGAVSRVLKEAQQAVRTMWVTRRDNVPAVQFTVDTDRREHETLVAMFREAPEIRSVEQSEAWERD
jgi:putative Mg2+ transporter-C (MgtC) family protein